MILLEDVCEKINRFFMERFGVIFSTLFFASFILDKHIDTKALDPEAAGKIASQIFTPEFLRTVLTGNSVMLQSQALTHVPMDRFAPVLNATQQSLFILCCGPYPG